MALRHPATAAHAAAGSGFKPLVCFKETDEVQLILMCPAGPVKVVVEREVE